MHYISPVRLNWYTPCSFQTDVVQQRGKSENLFKLVQVLSAIVSQCSPYQLWSQAKCMRLWQYESLSSWYSEHFITFLIRIHCIVASSQLSGNPKAICCEGRKKTKPKRKKQKKQKQSNLDCQTLECCASLMNFYEAKQQHNLPTHNTCEDLWSNKLILRALINL